MLAGLLLFFIIIGALGDVDLSFFNSHSDYDPYEELKPCTKAWRSNHPFGYNQFTGGWNEEEDRRNGF